MRTFYVIGLVVLLSLLIGYQRVSDNASTVIRPQDETQPFSQEVVETPAILGPEEGEKLHFFDGRYVILKATQEANGSQQLFAGTETIPAGTSIPVHAHDAYDEIIFVHQGEAILTLGDRKQRVGPGTTMYIPAGTWHGVESANAELTTILFVFPEPEFAKFFRDVGYPDGETPPQLTDADWDRLKTLHQMRTPSSDDESD